MIFRHFFDFITILYDSDDDIPEGECVVLPNTKNGSVSLPSCITPRSQLCFASSVKPCPNISHHMSMYVCYNKYTLLLYFFFFFVCM